MHIRIITDDFTSATDGLASFAQRGWSTAVALQAAYMSDATVVSTDTDSRILSAQDAQAAVTPWAQQWRTAQVLVKQFDSTLRGPVAAEVLAVRAASQRSKLLIVPAFPEAGRTTVNGCVLVDGVPVHQTAFAHDPLNPVRESSLPALFAAEGVALTLATSPAQALTLLQQHDAVVLDATQAQDLHSMCRLALACDTRDDILWAGSTGLLRAMAQALPVQTRTAQSLPPHAQHIAVVVGSQNPQSRAQMHTLCVGREAQAQHRTAPSNWQVFATPETRGNPAALSQALILEVCTALRHGACDGLIVTGGETAKLLAHALDAQAIQVLGEIEAGIPLCLLHTAHGTFPLITKAGGFGDAHVFQRCIAALSTWATSIPQPSTPPSTL